MDDLEPIPLSALQHWAYCPRPCGLLHLEQAFDDNLHTLRGQSLRGAVAETAAAVQQMLKAGLLPAPLVGDPAAQRCGGCSLRARCQPEAPHHPALAAGLRHRFGPDDR
jgi:hypothetical protein